MLPDFNRLKVFYHVYTEQSTTRAAKALHITQSGVSQHIKKLENEVQVALFTRVNRKLIPTAAAHKLYAIVSAFMMQLENGVRDINESFEMPSGELRIGAPSEFGKTYLPGIMASFRRQYPNVSFYLELGDPNVLFEKVSQAELDFAYIDILPIFTNTPGGETTYTIHPIVKEQFVCACSQTYYNAHVLGAGYDELIQLQYIGYKKDIALFRSWFKLHFDTAPSSLDMVFVADNAGAIIAAIEQDMGIGVIVSHLVSDQIADKTIVPITGSDRKLENTIACVQFRNKAETLTERCFKEHMRHELGSISQLKLIDRDVPA
ncbi:LysR family transcriptional regulator [Pseudodesulfovibrio sp. JC047]|uniref:LysR family transcriptional regulator n=1 Tax=Pseudodesulfovibrio sp. JC047 TaxID=2683199 RepID=UPI0013D86AA2|nr:LysR family transcriptional regulator [Pseudodesulfovibrio sp. JC047]NDV18368.1 LysR family transcriptional regulator [Pseudodesulfovibrio sp. JC047]